MEDDMTGLPQVDDSFGWLPPSHRQQPFTHPTQPKNVLNTVFDGPGPSQQTPHSALASTYLPNQLHFNHDQYSRSGYVHEGAPPAAPAGAMIELGLMTESEIDSGWFSFMQDCGIMDTSGSAGVGG